jgi:hypothetical protein
VRPHRSRPHNSKFVSVIGVTMCRKRLQR